MRDGVGALIGVLVCFHKSSNTHLIVLHRLVCCGSLLWPGGTRFRPLYAPWHRGRALRCPERLSRMRHRGSEAAVEQAAHCGAARARGG